MRLLVQLRTVPLPKTLLRRAIAHRGLHNIKRGAPENSLPAFEAAISAGYGIELDIQLSRDGEAMVFHDYDLARLVGRMGAVRDIFSWDLISMELKGGQGARIPTLTEVLSIVAGRVPLLIEIKPQDLAMSANVGRLEAATAKALTGYQGELAVMSFSPHSIAEMARVAKGIPRGLTTSGFRRLSWPLPRRLRAQLREIVDFDKVGASFISHDVRDLARPRVQELRAQGTPALCWTVRSLEAEIKARKYADNITFEGYSPLVA